MHFHEIGEEQEEDMQLEPLDFDYCGSNSNNIIIAFPFVYKLIPYALEHVLISSPLFPVSDVLKASLRIHY
jgi:hypothetical protein